MFGSGSQWVLKSEYPGSDDSLIYFEKIGLPFFSFLNVYISEKVVSFSQSKQLQLVHFGGAVSVANETVIDPSKNRVNLPQAFSHGEVPRNRR